jgi:hypothetical protein
VRQRSNTLQSQDRLRFTAGASACDVSTNATKGKVSRGFRQSTGHIFIAQVYYSAALCYPPGVRYDAFEGL